MPGRDGLSASLPVAGIQAARARVPELVVISGKGGTGKTSVVASFAVLADDVVVADCDVDAADLHLVLAPEILETHTFVSGHEAVIRQGDCDASGTCHEVCRFGAVIQGEGSSAFAERNCGEWFSSTTRNGPMVHARLGIAAENSGKLVSTVRNEAQKAAVQNGSGILLVDGPPGIGCPVIAAITGATGVLVVTEPTVSGAHDMERVLELAAHFQIPAAVCVNRWDINPEGAESIEARARAHGATIVGRIRYDAAVTQAQVEGRTVVELGGVAADDIRTVWDRVQQWMEGSTFPGEEF